MEQAGAAIVLDDRDCSGPRLAAEVGKLIGDPAKLAAMGRASLALARPDAAAAVATIVLAAA
jgi:UDP-N-acetylglucosamine--N-acetylmuramyl-(pentapeptide) pyrophosphoryl-undecaprenol N-acetylglucosamine transferase